MKKQLIKVPEGIQYLSDWGGFFDAIPSKEHFILNKKHCGCGATEAFLRTDRKVILASPRKHLLYNKFEQHLLDSFHLYRWADDKEKYFKGNATEKEVIQFDENLTKYIKDSGSKILVTYDSIYKVRKAIAAVGDSLDEWIVVVDEFQAIFSDCQYKAETERQFCEELKQCPSVVYLSATPFLEDYLDDVSLFSSLLMCELEWEAGMIVEPKVVYTELKNSTTKDKCCEIINDYKNSQGPTLGDIQSTEAVFYINNVEEIRKIIKSSGLKAEEVNILCSATPDNLNKIKKLGKDFKLGDIPREGEPHKKFTFCTSTVYLGADFYSTNAFTYIFANPNINSMALDVSIDLQQILGRQRLEENPFRNTATLFFKTKAGQDKREIDMAVQEKKEETQKQIENFNSAPHKELVIEALRDNIKRYNHSNHYCCIVEDANHNVTVEENELLIASEKRALEIANKIYQSDYSMYCALKGGVDAQAKIDSKDEDLQTLYEAWVKDGSFKRKAQLYCQMYEGIPKVLEKFNAFIPPKYKEYHDALGYDGMKARKWQESDIKKAIEEANRNIPIDHNAIYSEIVKRVAVGKMYSKGYLKEMFKDIYKQLKIHGKPTASDISNYITVKETSIRKSRKKIAMLEVVSLYRRNVSVFPIIGKIDKGQTWDIDKVLNELIKDSRYFDVKKKVDKVRAAKTKDAKDKAKLSLPLVCWNGVFSSRGKTGISTYSSYTALDFDKISGDKRMVELREWLKTIDCVYAIFTTPSGNGLKAIILHDNLYPVYHYNMYKRLLTMFDCPEIDDKTTDIGRGNFLSFDHNVWINPNVVPFHFEVDADEQIEGVDETVVANDTTDNYFVIPDEDNSLLNKFCQHLISDEKIINLFKKCWTGAAVKNGRNNAALSYAGILCLAGVDKEKARHFIEKLIPKFNLTEIMDYAYENNQFGARRRHYWGR